MNPISITTIASLRRALALPGVLVLVDRNDVLGPTLEREPARLAEHSRPRTVVRVRSASVVLRRDGRDGWLDLPKASDLVVDGSNAFSIRHRAGADGTDRLIRYRLELPGTPGAAVPSTLGRSHPYVGDDVVASEREAAEAMEREKQARWAEAEKAMTAINAAPRPAEDPRWPALRAAMATAIEAALERGLYYNREVENAVVAATESLEFAVLERLPDLALGSDHVAEAAAALALGHAPRGTWRRTVRTSPDGRGWGARTMISSGRAEKAANYEASFAERGGAATFRRMVEGEVYGIRQEVEAAMAARADASALARLSPRPSVAYHGITTGSHRFSTVTVESIEADGSIRLEARKRGSPRRWKISMGAARLARLVSEAAGSSPTDG